MRLPRLCLGLLIGGLGLGGSAFAYINGGVYHSGLKDYTERQRGSGGSVAVGAPLAAEDWEKRQVAPDTLVAADDDARYRQFFNQLVAGAVRDLPPVAGEPTLSAAQQRELATVARAAIRAGVTQRRGHLERGSLGPLDYEVGLFEFQAWYVSEERGQRRVDGHRTGYVPIIALRRGQAQTPPPAAPRAEQR